MQWKYHTLTLIIAKDIRNPWTSEMKRVQSMHT